MLGTAAARAAASARRWAWMWSRWPYTDRVVVTTASGRSRRMCSTITRTCRIEAGLTEAGRARRRLGDPVVGIAKGRSARATGRESGPRPPPRRAGSYQAPTYIR